MLPVNKVRTTCRVFRIIHKEWKADPTWLASELERALQSLHAAAAGAENLPRRPGLNPVPWTLGHVAFMIDFIVTHPLRLPTPGGVYVPSSAPRLPIEVATDDDVIDEHESPVVLASTAPRLSPPAPSASKFLSRNQTWTIYDSSRVTNDERWDRVRDGTLPDAKEYLDQAIATVMDLVRSSGPLLNEVKSYLVLYGLIHMLWHVEDVLHTRNVHGLAAPIMLKPPSMKRHITALPPAATQKEATPKALNSVVKDVTAMDASKTEMLPAPSWQPGGDVRHPGGTYYLGTERETSRRAPLILDCEK